ncbi:MAG: hypothetical protein OEY10_05380, partial [Nitrosopumilus sp.]|nr:hypothetical protein [Nitrosopumilus sp.]
MAELPVPQSTFVGRPSTGDLKAMTPAEALTLLNIPGVDETSTDTTKDKLVSNALALGWERARNQSYGVVRMVNVSGT